MANPELDQSYYFEQLYPLQDRVLQLVNDVDTGFYLTGGTALSRGYLNHRFSDDLDLFTNLDPHFGTWGDQVIDRLSQNEEWELSVLLRQAHFARLLVTEGTTVLKIELVDDVPFHVGDFTIHPLLGRLDSVENILANKLSAVIGRNEPKDVADIWALTRRYALSPQEALGDANNKAAGIYPALVARVLYAVSQQDWETIRWIDPPDPEQFVAEVKALAESLLLVE